ncbi:HNH endonuclease [Pseudohalioglobus sediminis]|uniref:HNH endonuclease n=1 Tax=Pseudohalioglobus sediminis TaxID=2606449 RepID=A0A5B0X4S9_9GAMM|nr:HNH endonuclease [Pseudohalioglobus sediminis]KAA1194344.1 HNH endonuclease [Pseudohalioglobus sediminis]
MPTKPLDRLMFAQGGLCFFCNEKLPKAEASVEHLVPSSRAGSNSDDNCVACCKAVNALLGSMSLKEKIRVVLNQKGNFKCPNGVGGAKPKTKAPSTKISNLSNETLDAIVKNLKSRGNARPRKVKTLSSTIKSLPQLKLNDQQVKSVIEHLSSTGKIVVTDEKVTYKL